jgi:hypothetical protein
VFLRAAEKIWVEERGVEVLSVIDAPCGIVFVSRRLVSDWSVLQTWKERR